MKLAVAVLLCSVATACAGDYGDKEGGDWMSKMMQNFMGQKDSGSYGGGSSAAATTFIMKLTESLLNMARDDAKGGTWKFNLPIMSGEFSYGWDDDNDNYIGDGLALPKSHWKLESKGEIPSTFGKSKGDYKWSLGASGGNSGGRLGDNGNVVDFGKGWGDWNWKGGYDSDSGGWSGYGDGGGVMQKMLQYMMEKKD